jgi:hypothetical protein
VGPEAEQREMKKKVMYKQRNENKAKSTAKVNPQQ